jgi:8-oxo-dGTP pyrophosphatase MutT (NUDIX family)
MHEEQLLYEGKWLNLKKKEFSENKVWEYVERNKGTRACGIIAKTEKNELILIRQYRHPVGNYVIEFPAGLVDENETIEDSALRELKEETGCEGYIVKMSSPVYSSPGLTNEAVVMVEVKVTHQGPPCPEEDENIEVLTYQLNELNQQLNTHLKKGDVIDAKLACFCQGLNFR